MKIKVVKGLIKNKKDVMKIMKFLKIPYPIDESKSSEIDFVLKDVRSQIENGFKINLFYKNPTIGHEVFSKRTEKYKGLSGILDWEFNFDEIEDLADFLEYPVSKIKVVKLKDL